MELIYRQRSIGALIFGFLLVVIATELSRQLVPTAGFSPFWPPTGVLLGLTLFYGPLSGLSVFLSIWTWAVLHYWSDSVPMLIICTISLLVPYLVALIIRASWKRRHKEQTSINFKDAILFYAFLCFFVTLPSALLSASVLSGVGAYAEVETIDLASIYWLSEFSGTVLFLPFMLLIAQRRWSFLVQPSRLTWIIAAIVLGISSLSYSMEGLYKQLPIFIGLPFLAYYGLIERNALHFHSFIVVWVIISLFSASTIPVPEGENNDVLFVSGFMLMLLGFTITLHTIWLISEAQRQVADRLKEQSRKDLRTDILNERGLTEKLALLNEGSHIAINVRLYQSKDMIESLGINKFPLILKEIGQRLASVLPENHCLGIIGGASVVAFCRINNHEQGLTASFISSLLTEKNFFEDKSLSIKELDIALIKFNSNDKNELLEKLTIAAHLASKNPIDRTFTGDINEPKLLEPLHHFNQFQSIKKWLDESLLIMWGQVIQPISDTSKYPKMEMLARLKQPNGNILPPAEFIPLFEKFGFQSEFDKYVLHACFNIIRSLRKNVKYTINVSAESFAQLNFPELIDSLVTLYDIDPTRFCLEITESNSLPSVDITKSNISKLNQRGIEVGLDDFGTGFATYAYLMDIPFNFVKLDGRFIQNIDTNRANYETVKSIVAVAKSLNMETVAEYVETSEEFEAVKALGVDYAQGFGISKPAALIIEG